MQALIPCEAEGGTWTPATLAVEAQKYAEGMLDEHKCFAEVSCPAFTPPGSRCSSSAFLDMALLT